MEKQDLHKLVELAQSGNREALERVCHHLQNTIKGRLSKVINDPELVEDLSQETYLRLLRGFQNIKEPIKIKSFVAKIALGVINDHFREYYKWKDIIVRDEHPQEEPNYVKGCVLKDDEGLFNKITDAVQANNRVS